MQAAADQGDGEPDGIDPAALRMMLCYVEAECRRIGANDAARHAALAAALMPARVLPIAPPARGVGIH